MTTRLVADLPTIYVRGHVFASHGIHSFFYYPMTNDKGKREYRKKKNDQNGRGNSIKCCHLAMPIAFNIEYVLCAKLHTTQTIRTHVNRRLQNFRRLSYNLFTVQINRGVTSK